MEIMNQYKMKGSNVYRLLIKRNIPFGIVILLLYSYTTVYTRVLAASHISQPL